MYPLGGGNPYESVVPVQNRKITINTNGTYLNKLDKFAQYKRKKAEQNAAQQLLKFFDILSKFTAPKFIVETDFSISDSEKPFRSLKLKSHFGLRMGPFGL